MKLFNKTFQCDLNLLNWICVCASVCTKGSALRQGTAREIPRERSPNPPVPLPPKMYTNFYLKTKLKKWENGDSPPPSHQRKGCAKKCGIFKIEIARLVLIVEKCYAYR